MDLNNLEPGAKVTCEPATCDYDLEDTLCEPVVCDTSPCGGTGQVECTPKMSGGHQCVQAVPRCDTCPCAGLDPAFPSAF